MKKTLVFLILTCIFLVSVFTQCTLAEKDPVQETLDSLCVENQFPGINASYISADGKQLNYSTGYADTVLKTVLTAEHTMLSGSIGKTYAVAVLMQLIEEGNFTLDDHYMSFFSKDSWVSNIPNIHDITIRMLLQHTSGLPRYIYHHEVWDSLKYSPDKWWTHKDRLMYVFNDEPVHAPGKGWEYSDTGYLLIGLLIETILDTYFYEEVQARLLNPKQLQKTYAADHRDMRNLAVGYTKPNALFNFEKPLVENEIYAFNPQFEFTGGGFYSTTEDLAKWAKLYYGSEFFSDALLKEIITPTENGKDLWENTSYGMGSFIYTTRHGIAYGHTGTMPGYKSIFAYFPDQEIAIAMQTNCDYATERMDLVAAVEDMMDAILAEAE